MQKLKGYVVYGGNPGWYHCILVLENGFAPCSHLCSATGFAHGDLWERRKERQAAAAVAGFEVDLDPAVYTEEELNTAHPEIIEKHKNDAGYEAMSKAFTAALGSDIPKPSVEIVVSK